MKITNIFLTGSIHSGKSTIINKVIEQMPDVIFCGFRTLPIYENKSKEGFYLESFHGSKQIFAHTDLQQDKQYDIYKFDYTVFENFGVSILSEALTEDCVIVMDEIGMMERHAKSFCQTLEKCLNSNQFVMGAFQKRASWFLNILKDRSDTKIYLASDANRNSLPDQIISLIKPHF